MTRALFEAGGVSVTVSAILAAVAIAQWLVFAAISAFSRRPLPKKGLRRSETSLLISSWLFLFIWLIAFDARTLLTSRRAAAVEASATAARRSSGSCSAIAIGMTSTEVESKLGKPDETRRDEETRGPGASTWVYLENRCAVHLFEDTVEFID
jgi:hypothetical protein